MNTLLFSLLPLGLESVLSEGEGVICCLYMADLMAAKGIEIATAVIMEVMTLTKMMVALTCPDLLIRGGVR